MDLLVTLLNYSSNRIHGWNQETQPWHSTCGPKRNQAIGLKDNQIAALVGIYSFSYLRCIYSFNKHLLLPGKSHRWRSLVGCSPWGCWELDTTQWLHFHFSLSCIGEGNGNPLQCSCLENPRDGRAWWAAVYGVAQSRTRLKQRSSSSSNSEV